MCACVSACVRACVCACVCVCVFGGALIICLESNTGLWEVCYVKARGFGFLLTRYERQDAGLMLYVLLSESSATDTPG